MFKVIENGTNRLDIEMSGKLDAESMKVALEEVVLVCWTGLRQH